MMLKDSARRILQNEKNNDGKGVPPISMYNLLIYSSSKVWSS